MGLQDVAEPLTAKLCSMSPNETGLNSTPESMQAPYSEALQPWKRHTWKFWFSREPDRTPCTKCIPLPISHWRTSSAETLGFGTRHIWFTPSSPGQPQAPFPSPKLSLLRVRTEEEGIAEAAAPGSSHPRAPLQTFP